MKLYSESLIVVIGGMGTGKSTYAAFIAKNALKNKIKCYCTEDLHGTIKICPDDVLKYNLDDSIVIIDEAGHSFNSRDYKNFTTDHFKWFSTNRHRNTQVYVIVQSWKRIDIVLRELAQRVVLVDRWFFSISTTRSYIQTISYVDETGEFNERFTCTDKSWFYRPSYYWRFDSYVDYLPERPTLDAEPLMLVRPVGRLAKIRKAIFGRLWSFFLFFKGFFINFKFFKFVFGRLKSFFSFRFSRVK